MAEREHEVTIRHGLWTALQRKTGEANPASAVRDHLTMWVSGADELGTCGECDSGRLGGRCQCQSNNPSIESRWDALGISKSRLRFDRKLSDAIEWLIAKNGDELEVLDYLEMESQSGIRSVSGYILHLYQDN